MEWLPSACSKKNERPVGVPAALAWGMEGYSAGRSVSGFPRGWSFDCARQQQNNAQEQDRYDHPPARNPNLSSNCNCDSEGVCGNCL